MTFTTDNNNNNSNFYRFTFLIVFVISIRVSGSDFLSSSGSGYSYPHPSNPPAVIQFEEPPPSAPIYLPPPSVVLPPIFADDPLPVFPPTPNPPAQTYLPPKPGPTYLPPAPANELFPPLISNDDSVIIPAAPAPPPQIIGGGDLSYLPPNPPSAIYLPAQPYQLKIENMSCVQGMQFRAVFRMPSGDVVFPVVDDSSSAAAEKCISALGANQFQMELMTFNKMLSCGVKRCGGNNAVEINDNNNNFDMCVKLRIPTVKGVRLPEDGLITLRCKPQERILSQTKHIKLGTNKIRETIHGRSSKGYVASGGQQNQLKSTIKILRKRPGTQTFDQNVHSDSVIHLGEELALRATIHNEDNGWKNSLMGPVLITGLSSQKSALLVNQNGCVNAEMRTICPQQPKHINPLTTELRFRAFLFQETPQGDEMVLSVKMQGCLHWQDCVKSDVICNDNNLRHKRELQMTNYSEIENWESQLAFKVVPLKRDIERNHNFNDSKLKNNSLVLGSVVAFIVLNIFLLILLVFAILKRKREVMYATKDTY